MENHLDISKNFISYDLALKLKELGFNEECFGVYYNKDGDVRIYDGKEKGDAPLWQQAFKFIRDKYNLTTTFHYRKKSDNTYVSIYEITKKEDFEELTHFSKVFYIDEYELQTKALKKLIEIIENKVS